MHIHYHLSIVLLFVSQSFKQQFFTIHFEAIQAQVEPAFVIFIVQSFHFHIQTESHIKRVFYYCQTSVLFLYNRGIFSGYQSLLAYTLVGPPVWGLVLDPLAAYTSTTIYIITQQCYISKLKILHFQPLRKESKSQSFVLCNYMTAFLHYLQHKKIGTNFGIILGF